MRLSPADQEIMRARTRAQLAASFSPASVLFDAQLRAFNDPSDFRAVLCSRRAGKSILACVELLHAALCTQNVDTAYIGLTRQQARDVVWRDLLAFNDKHSLNGEANETTLTLSMPNGSRIQLRGVADRADIEWFRGRKFALVIVDEAQSGGARLRDLIEDIIGPTLLDHHGRVMLAGTPGYVAAGYWYEATQGRAGYSVHSWTLRDNPHLRGVDAFLAKQAKRLGGESVPKFQREYLGKWVRDATSLVFAGFGSQCVYTDLPRDAWYTALPTGRRGTVIGVDLGSADATSISVCAWYPDDGPSLYLIDEWVATRAEDDKLNVDVVEQRLCEYVEKYRPRIPPVVDEGGLGKMIADTIRDRKRVNVQSAVKNAGSVLAGVERMNADLASGRLRLPATSRAAADCAVVVWDARAAERGERKIAKTPHSDALDSLRYAHGVSRHHGYREPVPAPTSARQHDAMLQEMFRRAETRTNAPYYARRQPPG